MSNDHRPPARTPPTAPQDEPWAELRALTAARIALPRAGASLATSPQLDLRLAHARAGDAEARLAAHAGSGHDVVVAIADGLSARAVEMHARPLLAAALPRLAGWRIAPLVVVRQGRVAIGDEIAKALRADIAVVLIGER